MLVYASVMYLSVFNVDIEDAFMTVAVTVFV
jgi:hypothetical protein